MIRNHRLKLVSCAPAAVAALSLLLFTQVARAEPPERAGVRIQVKSRESLVRLGSVGSTGLTPEATRAAKLALEFFETGKVESAHAALDIYERIIPKENFGGDYTAMQWLIEHKLASPEKRVAMVTDASAAGFADLFASDGYQVTKEYLNRKYKLAKLEDGETANGDERRAFLEDCVYFNNPRRESWEKTSAILKEVDVKPGFRIADVGSGPGYFAFRFSNMVGEKGKVYAIDNVMAHTHAIATTAARNGITNVVSVLASNDHTIGLGADQVDMVWLFSLYHVIYATYSNEARDAFVESIKRAMKKDAVLYVVGNGIVPDGVLPYHGPSGSPLPTLYLDPALLIAQFQEYGFRLTGQFQVIPQRYVLVFKKA